MNADEAFRTRYFAAEQTQFLSQQLIAFIAPTLRELKVAICHTELADDTDRGLLEILTSPAYDWLDITTLPSDGSATENLYPEPLQREMIPIPSALTGNSLQRWHDDQAGRLSGTADDADARIYHFVRGTNPAQAVPLLAERLVESAKYGYYQAAVRYGQQLFEIQGFPREYNPHVHATLRAYSAALVATGRSDDAVAFYRHASDYWNNPRLHAAAYYTEAMVRARFAVVPERDFRKASEKLERAVQAAENIEDDHERAYHLAFLANAEAYLAMRKGDVDGALSWLNEDLRILDSLFSADVKHQHRIVVRANRATLLRRSGRAGEALVDLDYVVENDPHVTEYRVDRAIVLHGMGRHQEALEELTFAVEHCIAVPEAYYNRAVLQLEQGEQTGAIDDLRSALRLDPGDHQTVLLYIETLIAADRFDDARRVLDEQPALDVDDGMTALRARLATSDGNAASALTILDEAIDRMPDSTSLRVERSSVLYELGRLADALADLDAVVEQGETDPVLQINRLKLLHECGLTAEVTTGAALLLASGALPAELADHLRDFAPYVLPDGHEEPDGHQLST
ncbi:tetratricopeptide repeat protein [Nonomuraea aurantiaca]|uniref:tetratricopeptide repeat protein n=1 Tax=Nonomuraea aurantiaca TaxID=2878562 RepID=UPI001CD9C4E1|nr:tetratricopeptide repeat protein [Nonomuraea aurantiaca]MCA2230156.1 tetratricopeptide repeat protein [Nonomuraea aurantiaca]